MRSRRIRYCYPKRCEIGWWRYFEKHPSERSLARLKIAISQFTVQQSEFDKTQIRREFQSFPSKVGEIPAFVSKMLHQSLDFHKRSFSPPGVLIYESDGVSRPPTFG